MGILFFISLIGYGLFFKVMFSDMKFGASIFSGFCLMVISSYKIVGILGYYDIGPKLIIGFGYVFFLIGIIKYLLQNNGEVNCKIFLQPSFIIFLICVALSVFLLNDAVLENHDAFSFWARAVREMYVFRHSYFNIASTMPHNDYNFAVPTLQYCLMCEYGWSNSHLFYVTSAGIISSLCLICDSYKDNLFKALIFAVLCAMVYPFFPAYSIASLTIDGLLCLTFLAGLFSLFKRENNSVCGFLPSILASGLLPLLKLYTGLLFAVVICFSLITEKLTERRHPKDAKNKIKPALIAVTVLMIICSEFSWRIFYNYNIHLVNTEKQNSGLIETYNGDVSFFEIISGNSRTKKAINTSKKEKADRIIHGLNISAKRLLTNIWNSNINYLSLLAALILLFIPVFIFTDRQKKICAVKIFSGLLTGSAIYIIGYVVTFYVQPGVEREAVRYIGVAAIPILFLIFYITVDALNKFVYKSFNKTIPLLSVCLMTVLLIYIGDFGNYFDAYTAKKPMPASVHAEKIVNQINDYMIDNDSNVIIDNSRYVYKFGRSGLLYSYAYYSLPKHLSAIYCNNKSDNLDYTEQELREIILKNGCKRLFVMASNGQYNPVISAALGVKKIWPNYIYVYDVIYDEYNNFNVEYINRIHLYSDIG